MTLTDRLLAVSRKTRRRVLYRLARPHLTALGISTDGHGRGLIFHPQYLTTTTTGHDDALIEAAEETLDHLSDLVAAHRFPAWLENMIGEEHADYLNHRTTI